jgi:hypothetical protein
MLFKSLHNLVVKMVWHFTSGSYLPQPLVGTNLMEQEEVNSSNVKKSKSQQDQLGHFVQP